MPSLRLSQDDQAYLNTTLSVMLQASSAPLCLWPSRQCFVREGKPGWLPVCVRLGKELRAINVMEGHESWPCDHVLEGLRLTFLCLWFRSRFTSVRPVSLSSLFCRCYGCYGCKLRDYMLPRFLNRDLPCLHAQMVGVSLCFLSAFEAEPRVSSREGFVHGGWKEEGAGLHDGNDSPAH